MPTAAPTVAQHFTGKAPAVRATYDRIVAEARKFGPVVEDPKKTSIHLNRRTAFAGIATRSAGLILTLKLAKDIPSARVRKREQVSANRWHLEIPLAAPAEVDAELLAWLRAAYELSA